MNNILLIPGLTLLFFTQVSCSSSDTRSDPARGGASLELSYAKGFSVEQVGSSKLVEIHYPHQGATQGYRYLLVPHGDSVPDAPDDAKVIRIPLETIVVTSTTHVPMLDYLGETDRLVGFPTLDYISSEQMRARIDKGHIVELGIDKGMDIERIAALSPDMVMGYSLSGDYGQFKKIEELGIPVVINAEYLERHPLGRAEWIKFVGLFFEKEDLADSIFSGIEKDYLQTAAGVEGIETPSVISGIVYGDAWFLPGGDNYAARLFEDAGCHYLWRDNPSNGFLQLSFESVYSKAHDAEFWIGVGSYSSLAELKAADQRYARFKAFQAGNVYTYNARVGAKGGNEYLELGYLRPDLILKDLVKIVHPNRLPEHNLYFHKKLP